MDALILAGGQTPPEFLQQLDAESAVPDRALVPINGRPMLDYVLDAVRGCPDISRIAVAGTPNVLTYLQQTSPEVMGVADTGHMIDNATAGLRALRDAPGASNIALITTSDVPLVTGATFTEFLRGFERQKLEAGYALATREVCEAAFPGGRRTYAHLADGDVTAGNAVIVEGHIIESLAREFDKFYRVRKNPLAMARIFGLGFLWRALRKTLTVADAEAKLSELVGCRAAAVLMQDAAIAFDVDKIEDYQVAVEALQKRNSTAPVPVV